MATTRWAAVARGASCRCIAARCLRDSAWFSRVRTERDVSRHAHGRIRARRDVTPVMTQHEVMVEAHMRKEKVPEPRSGGKGRAGRKLRKGGYIEAAGRGLAGAWQTGCW